MCSCAGSTFLSCAWPFSASDFLTCALCLFLSFKGGGLASDGDSSLRRMRGHSSPASPRWGPKRRNSPLGGNRVEKSESPNQLRRGGEVSTWRPDLSFSNGVGDAAGSAAVGSAELRARAWSQPRPWAALQTPVPQFPSSGCRGAPARGDPRRTWKVLRACHPGRRPWKSARLEWIPLSRTAQGQASSSRGPRPTPPRPQDEEADPACSCRHHHHQQWPWVFCLLPRPEEVCPSTFSHHHLFAFTHAQESPVI
ncbi:uncharacterized protein LOC108316709 [Cebus imitator]|uniref:uncharacterized protein LOC108316709 n=1 Tax=Cebus imitator TaxID=2715852 RepID=UPI00080A3783|nr:uncharacterized protein LOC108316709 [Cebus imitator]